jgi:hypothetical protein
MNGKASLKGSVVLLAALALQGGHYIEHLAQYYQHAFLYLSIKESHGILFFADLEWNHFVFNLLYFVLVAYAAVKMEFFTARAFQGMRNAIYRNIFLGGVLLQGYHVLEHSGRIGQHLQTGCTPCPGFLGWYFDGIYLHFTYNSLTLFLPLIAFFGLGIHRQLWGAWQARKAS